ncbi:MAG: type II toxin-antitoxin system VapC family toxin [Caldilineaceae bacterium]|nr:type II toxin-antitoxin system VapC family toxin [Caldilineaceae bacterium]
MVNAVADTHAVIWYVFNNPRLSERAISVFREAVETNNQIAVSSITFVEIVYLLEKGRVPAATLERLTDGLQKPGAVLVEIPVDSQISGTMARVNRAEIPDMPDRIIAATALHLGVPLISRDHRIQLSAVATVW